MRKAKLLAVSVGCAVTALIILLQGAPAASADDVNLLDTLRQKGVLTQQEYERLKAAAPAEGRAQTQASQFAPAEQSQVRPQVGYEEGFFLRTTDGNFSLRFNGRIAENLLFSEPDSTPSNTQTVDRARLSADATFYKYFRVRLENEFSSSSLLSSSAGLRDAYIAVTPMPEFNLQAGQFVVPLSYELILSKRYTNFVERAAVINDTVSPRRDIGVVAYGQFANKLVQYHLGVMNGPGQNVADNNPDKDLVAHLAVAPFVNGGPAHLRGFNVGSGVTWGHQPNETLDKSGVPTTKSSIKGLTETGFTFYPAVTRHGDRVRWGTHAAWLDGPCSVVSEYVQTEEARNGLGTNGSDLPRLYTDGAYIDGTWLITGETKPYNARIRPKRPLWDTKDPGPGAWEAALRYEYYKLRHEAGPGDAALDNRYDALVAGINWYPNEFLRLSLNYLYGHFSGKAPNPDKHSNNAVLCRAQIEF